MPTVDGIEYVHAIRYFSKGIDQQGPFYLVEYELDDWADTDAFVNGLLGVTTGTASSANYREPHRHPLSQNLMCMKATVGGLGRIVKNQPGYPQYEAARVTAEYRAPGPLVGPVLVTDEPGLFHHIAPGEGPLLWVTQEIASQTQSITHPGAKYFWENRTVMAPPNFTSAVPRPVGTPVQIDIYTTIYRLVYHQLPYLPSGPIRALRGRINSHTFLGAPPEHLLFRDYRTGRDWNTDGQTVQRVELDFVEQEQSWNMLLREDKMPGDEDAYDYIRSESGSRRFKVADLRPLGKLATG